MPLRVIKTILIVIALILIAPHAHAAHGEYTKYEISAALLPSKGEFRGGVRVYLPNIEDKKSPVHEIYTGFLQIVSVKLNDKEIHPKVKDGVMRVKGLGKLDILFGARFGGGAREDGPDNSGVVRGNTITNTAAFLQTGWYPRLKGPGLYSLSVFVPDGLVAVSEADVTAFEDISGGRRYDFELFSPVDHITLVVDRYQILSEEHGDVTVEAYFYKEDIEDAKKYLKRASEYITMYKDIIGPFPYKRFAVVEGALPTGYSMPTYTLIGKRVIKLPFIIDTSLGHEVLHQWFGNSVRTGKDGNWSEGLTSYMADYLYDEKKGKGAEYRKKLLLDYRNYVKPQSEISLEQFISPTDRSNRAVGYAKSAMVFHMLRGELGTETFYSGLRRLYGDYRDSEAGWDEVREAFESVSGRDLKGFFQGWTGTRGALEIGVHTAYPLLLGGKDKVYIEVFQSGEPREFLLPLKVITETGSTDHTVRVNMPRQGFELEAGGRPVAIVLDSGYDLMRRLYPAEVPPTVSMLTGAEHGIVVLPAGDPDTYRPVADVFASRGFAIVNEADLKYSDLMTKPSVIAASSEDLLRGIFASVPESPVKDAGFVFEVMKNPLSPGLPMALVHVSTREEAELAADKIVRYGGYSRIAIDKGWRKLNETAASQEGIRLNLALEARGVRLRDTLGLSEIIRVAALKPAIFVGEAHTSYEHHKVQLEFIRRLNEAGEKIAIGMEMFQTPFQNSIDGYLKGELSEYEFLQRSGYFKRWSYNWHLYREILDYARSHSIPVVALNQRSEIVRKVSSGGLDSLTKDEREQLPPGMDLVDPGYASRLKAVFNQHGQGKEFGNFYTSQVIWDETMAHSLAGYMKDNPGRKMVVITGQGHTSWRSGIPERFKRLTGLDYSLVIQYEGGTLDPRQADYILFTGAMRAPAFPVIGVKLRLVKEGLLVEEVREGAPADKAGIEKGDIITRAGQRDLKGIEDLKVELYDKRPGETVEIKALRKRFFRGFQEETFQVNFR